MPIISSQLPCPIQIRTVTVTIILTPSPLIIPTCHCPTCTPWIIRTNDSSSTLSIDQSSDTTIHISDHSTHTTFEPTTEHRTIHTTVETSDGSTKHTTIHTSYDNIEKTTIHTTRHTTIHLSDYIVSLYEHSVGIFTFDHENHDSAIKLIPQLLIVILTLLICN
jgi:hypothetical protein